jgi:MoxR-like ATPase
MSQFQGSSRYIADDGLMGDVNAAVVLGRPLLVKGEPGTGCR